jgi:hypothetical protein
MAHSRASEADAQRRDLAVLLMQLPTTCLPCRHRPKRTVSRTASSDDGHDADANSSSIDFVLGDHDVEPCDHEVDVDAAGRPQRPVSEPLR